MTKRQRPHRQLASEWATTQDLMDAGGVSRRTIWAWTERGLLPTPTMISQGRTGGAFNRYPASALGVVRFILARRADGLSLDEIKGMLDADAAARSPQPAAVASRDAAPTRPRPRR